jgi:hypothetical protein
MSAGSLRLQLVQVAAVQGVGLVRVTWSCALGVFLVHARVPGGRLVAEHQATDKARALELAARELDALAALAGMPA